MMHGDPDCKTEGNVKFELLVCEDAPPVLDPMNVESIQTENPNA